MVYINLKDHGSFNMKMKNKLEKVAMVKEYFYNGSKDLQKSTLS